MEHGRKGLSLPLSHRVRLGHPALNSSGKLILANMQILRHCKTFMLRFTDRQQQTETGNLCACLSYPIWFCPLTLTLFNSSLNASYIWMSGHAAPGQGNQNKLIFMKLKSTILISKLHYASEIFFFLLSISFEKRSAELIQLLFSVER